MHEGLGIHLSLLDGSAFIAFSFRILTGRGCRRLIWLIYTRQKSCKITSSCDPLYFVDVLRLILQVGRTVVTKAAKWVTN